MKLPYLALMNETEKYSILDGFVLKILSILRDKDPIHLFWTPFSAGASIMYILGSSFYQIHAIVSNSGLTIPNGGKTRNDIGMGHKGAQNMCLFLSLWSKWATAGERDNWKNTFHCFLWALATQQHWWLQSWGTVFSPGRWRNNIPFGGCPLIRNHCASERVYHTPRVEEVSMARWAEVSSVRTFWSKVLKLLWNLHWFPLCYSSRHLYHILMQGMGPGGIT